MYIGNNIRELPTIMIEDFLSSIFGMYCDPRIANNISKNIEGIAKYVWDSCSSIKKHSIGDKFGYYRKNRDVNQREKADIFLTMVDGLSYKDEDSISQELRDSLANLMSTHNSANNFYNEAPWAKQLNQLLPVSGAIPTSVLPDWVKQLSYVIQAMNLDIEKVLMKALYHITKNLLKTLIIRLLYHF